ncbi:hypothetical protein DL764_002418 [Monosporascus ibericus]|uniref:Zn(2)-C6 fungal-type domain-containing protein n=1 Tax=Monosporascus ibericus TaxID=155417 RepID=A0A4Q4TQ50_9PEZI|nr:hypothetical protein DL764_002418 [Monosporascus ibericus]
MDATQPELTLLSAAAVNNNQMQGQAQGPTPTHQRQQRTSAPYGHACGGCARAKCKCIISSRGAACERCRRLGRACTPSATVRKRSTAASRRATARDDRGGSGGSSDNGNGNCASGRTARLEEKLDDLVALLRSQASTAAVGAGAGAAGVGGVIGVSGIAAAHATTAAGPQQAPTPESTGDDQPRLRARDVFPFTQLVGPAAANQVAVPACYQDPDPGRAFAVPDHLEPRQSAEESLRIFRENHLRFFPAADIERERPFLWLNIRTLTCKSVAQQYALATRIREIIGQKVLVESERTMDLLLGLLAFLGWGYIQSAGRPILGVFAGVAAGMVSDMRLDKPTHFNPYKELHAFKPYRFPYPQPSYPTHRTNEQRRAALACWVLGVKSQHMRWTPHMEESLQKLADEPDWFGDQLLVALVRVFKVLEEVSHIRWSASDFDGRAAATRPTPMHYVKALRANLEDIRRGLPPQLVENRVVLASLYSTEAQINELGLQNPAPSSPPVSMDFGRTECFDGFLRATKLWLEKHFSFESADYIGFTISMHIFFSRLTQVLYRLSLTDDPAWDRAAVRHTVDLIATLETSAARFAGVARAAGFEGEGPGGADTFTRAAHALQATIPNWRAKLEQAGAIPVTTPAAGDNAGIADAGETGVAAGDATTVHESEFGSSLSVAQMQEFMMMDFADDPWITEFFNPF